MTDHKTGTRDEWLAAREQLLVREKEHTRLGDELAQQRRELPWVRVEKEYRFDTDDGEKALGELFDGRSQLLVYHFMFGPTYEAGCPTCSSMADGVDGVLSHLQRPGRDVRPRLAGTAGEAAGLQAPHGFECSLGVDRAHDFNFDLGFSTRKSRRATRRADARGAMPPIVEHNADSTGTDIVGYLTESPGFSTFVLDDGSLYHTYSTTGAEWSSDGLLPDPRPCTEGSRRGRGVATLDPPPRRVRLRVRRVHPSCLIHRREGLARA